MKKYSKGITIIVILTCVFSFLMLYSTIEIGVQKSNLKETIRSMQNIKDDWTVTGMASDSMAAYISYPQDKSDHTYSIYVNRAGLSFGYFFCRGGSVNEIATSIKEYRIADCNERCFISMNAQKIGRMEIDDGHSVQVIDIDSNNPFAIVLPINEAKITFFDINENPITFLENTLE